ncbi:hypothetical protein NQ318_003704 [Aromia moschata]|uniref:Uncharacterized protein n=1 Tax=Aromia moschata TaxID=1265417 RepID=A0AAV8YGX1_9CUCU|nr:hypothetical protein NQ318_003704 [Aromia moschata]
MTQFMQFLTSDLDYGTAQKRKQVMYNSFPTTVILKQTDIKVGFINSAFALALALPLAFVIMKKYILQISHRALLRTQGVLQCF